MASLLRNVNSQNIGFALVVAATGAADTAAAGLTAYVTIDNGAQFTGGGTFTNKGHGQYVYTLPQLESNGSDCSFLFVATNDIPTNADFHTDPTNWGALNIDAFGNIGVQGTLKRNTSVGIPFVMTDNVNHNPAIGLVGLAAFRSIDNGAFTATTNAPVENANGWYFLSLLNTETNGKMIAIRVTATGADDLDLSFPTVP